MTIASSIRGSAETAAAGASASCSSCIESLANLMAFHGTSVSLRDLEQSVGGNDPPEDVLRRIAKQHDYRAAYATLSWNRLTKAPLPLLAFTGKDQAVVVLALGDQEVLLQVGWNTYPRKMKKEEFLETWRGRVLLARPREEAGSSQVFCLSTLIREILRHRSVVLQIVLGSLTVQILGLFSPFAFQIIVDKVLVNRTESTLIVVFVALLLVAAFEFLCGLLRTYLVNHTGSRADLSIGLTVFKKLMSLSLSYFSSRKTGIIVSRLREIESIRSFLTGSALTALIDAIFTLVFLAAMAFYDTRLLIVVVLTLPLYVATSLCYGPLFRDRVAKKFAAGASNQSFLVESVTGIETIKSVHNEAVVLRQWGNRLDSFIGSSLQLSSVSSAAQQTVQLISKASTAVLLFVGAHEVIGDALSVGGLVAFNMLAQRVTAPVLRLSQVWQEFYQVKVSVDRLGDIMNTPAERPDSFQGLRPASFRPDIRFEDVDFRYSIDGSLVLDRLSLSMGAGEVIGIAGTSGSGKSTIAKLVQGLHVPVGGAIRVGGYDISTLDMGWLREQVGVVAQDSFLFSGTIADNIAGFDKTMSLEAIVEAASLAGAHAFITLLPEGYMTQVGERGCGLSGGQKQRIALARTLMLKPRILILDEATSALDYESEAAIQGNMAKIAAGRTVIIIAHRLSTLRRCNKIVIIEKGRWVESGSHAALLRDGGRYAALWRLQTDAVEAHA